MIRSMGCVVDSKRLTCGRAAVVRRTGISGRPEPRFFLRESNFVKIGS